MNKKIIVTVSSLLFLIFICFLVYFFVKKNNYIELKCTSVTDITTYFKDGSFLENKIDDFPPEFFIIDTKKSQILNYKKEKIANCTNVKIQKDYIEFTEKSEFYGDVVYGIDRMTGEYFASWDKEDNKGKSFYKLNGKCENTKIKNQF